QTCLHYKGLTTCPEARRVLSEFNSRPECAEIMSEALLACPKAQRACDPARLLPVDEKTFKACLKARRTCLESQLKGS
ncbi:MAG: hypothetical protein LE168_02360, partial [Endomicrobium sp.]|nr:hypothetical protein [Endomicrobium sp.]